MVLRVGKTNQQLFTPCAKKDIALSVRSFNVWVGERISITPKGGISILILSFITSRGVGG
jgi:hypothetical protein